MPAEYINLQSGFQLVAVYKEGASQEVKEAARALTVDLEGVDVSIISAMGTSQPGTPLVPTLVVDVRNCMNDAERVAKAMKRRTRPVKSCTVALEVTLFVCRCDFLSTKLQPLFVTGLQPDDEESFILRLYAKTKKMDLVSTISDATSPGSSLSEKVVNAFVRLLTDMNAHPMEVSVTPVPDSRHCTG